MRENAVPSFRRLRAFEAAAGARSLSAAAQALRLSQPALTHSIAQLEAELGARLFERGPEGAFLTAPGRIFARRVRRFSEQLRAALAAAAGRPADDPAIEGQAAKLASAQARSLIAIWRAGSFRAAARELGLAEPSLQRPARDLEQIVGAPLYRRSPAGLTVNDAGAEAARRIALALGEIRSGALEIDAAAASRTSLRIGVLALAPRILVARAAAPLLAAAGGQRIAVVEGPYDRLARDLHDGEIDLILGALRAPPPYATLSEEPLLEDPYVIVCRRGHPLLGLRAAQPGDLAGYDWVFPTAGLPRRAVLDAIIAQWGLPSRIQFETSCLTTIGAMLASSDRLSVLSRWNIALDARSDLTSLAAPAIPHAPRHVGLTLRRDWLPTPWQQAFIESLRREARALEERASDEGADRDEALAR